MSSEDRLNASLPGTSSDSALMTRVGESVESLVQQLARDHTLARVQEEGSLWSYLGKSISDAYMRRAQTEGVRGGRAIVMAGPPGAGKSRGVESVHEALGPERSVELGVDESNFITVDADDIKQLLLGFPVEGIDVDPALLAGAKEHWDHLISVAAPDALEDGRKLQRGELSTLVHPLSTALADEVRRDLIETQVDIKVEGTLRWMESPTVGQGPTLVRELEEAGYRQVSIVAVDTPSELCLEGARMRWEVPRSQGNAGARYTPPGAVLSCFEIGPDGGEISQCVKNADSTHQLACQSQGLEEVNLFVAHRSPLSPTIVEHIDRSGHSELLSKGAPEMRVASETTPPDLGVTPPGGSGLERVNQVLKGAVSGPEQSNPTVTVRVPGVEGSITVEPTGEGGALTSEDITGALRRLGVRPTRNSQSRGSSRKAKPQEEDVSRTSGVNRRKANPRPTQSESRGGRGGYGRSR